MTLPIKIEAGALDTYSPTTGAPVIEFVDPTLDARYKREAEIAAEQAKSFELELKRAEKARMKPQRVVAAHRPGRNKPCPCGSGQKSKRCCYGD